MKFDIFFQYQKILIVLFLFASSFNADAVNFEKAGITKLTFINKNSETNNDIFDITIGFNLFNPISCSTFLETQTFALNPNAELFFDVASYQKSFDDSLTEQFSTTDEDNEQLKKIFGCIKSVRVTNRHTGEEAKLYIYGSVDGSLKVFIIDSNYRYSNKFDIFHIDFDAALNAKSEYYNDCVNDIDKIYPNGSRSGSYKLALDSGVTAADFIHRMQVIYEDYFSTKYNFENLLKPESKPKINKCLFQVWIGANPLPEEYKTNQLKWKNILSADWTYKLYTDEDVLRFEFSSAESRKTYDALPNKTAQSDLLRFEILNKLGGVYVDLDTEPFEPIDFLVMNFDFFGMLYGPTSGSLFIDNYFIGSVPQHPIIKQVIENIISLSNKSSDLFPNLLTSIIPLTRAVYQHAGKYSTRDIILPVKYFNNYSTSIFSYGTHYPKRLWKK